MADDCGIACAQPLPEPDSLPIFRLSASKLSLLRGSTVGRHHPRRMRRRHRARGKSHRPLPSTTVDALQASSACRKGPARGKGRADPSGHTAPAGLAGMLSLLREFGRRAYPYFHRGPHLQGTGVFLHERSISPLPLPSPSCLFHGHPVGMAMLLMHFPLAVLARNWTPPRRCLSRISCRCAEAPVRCSSYGRAILPPLLHLKFCPV